MMTKISNTLSIFSFLVLFASINTNATFDEIAYTPVSIVELITIGKTYNKWKIDVVGVLYFNQENSLLFVDKEKYRF